MRLLSIFAAILMLAMSAAPSMAVDNSISAYCGADYAGSAYQRPGGFCDAVANNKTMLPDGRPIQCPEGFIADGLVCIFDPSA